MNGGAYTATRDGLSIARDLPVLRINTSAGRSNVSTSFRIIANVSDRWLFITSEIRPLLPITPSRSFRDRPRCSRTNSIAAVDYKQLDYLLIQPQVQTWPA